MYMGNIRTKGSKQKKSFWESIEQKGGETKRVFCNFSLEKEEGKRNLFLGIICIGYNGLLCFQWSLQVILLVTMRRRFRHRNAESLGFVLDVLSVSYSRRLITESSIHLMSYCYIIYKCFLSFFFISFHLSTYICMYNVKTYRILIYIS